MRIGRRSFQEKQDRLLRDAPRTLQIVSALTLVVLAVEFLSEVVFAEWFYFRYHRDYAYTLASRFEQWVYDLCVVLLALWMVGMAWALLRGASKRRDRGLFSPGALRGWGIVFGLMPILVLAAAPGAVAHVHLWLWCWMAAGACFALAARRSHAPSPLQGPPPPIE